MGENEHLESEFYYPEDADLSCLHSENIDHQKTKFMKIDGINK